MDFEYCKSERGHPVVIHRGYMYVKEREQLSKTIWKCREAQKRKCRGRLHISEDTVVKQTEHNHVPDAAKVAVCKALTSMKNEAFASHLPTQTVVANTFALLDDAAAGQAPMIKTLKRTVQRYRNEVRRHPVNPRNQEELVLVAPFTKTVDGRQFLLHDNHSKENRILIFLTDRNLNLLESNGHWFVDGTFKTVPSLFSQLFTVHVLKSEQVFAAAYVLMMKRTEESYREVLQQLKTLRPNLRPSSIMMDFEIQVMKAVQREFPGCGIRGCFFHFSQCLWRKIQEHGLQVTYTNDPEFAIQVRMLTSLAFVRKEDVVTVFEALIDSEFFQENENVLLPLVSYVEDVWIGRLDRRGGRKQPRFSHDVWNLYSSVTEGLPRTNNAVEGWHTGFSTMIAASHASIFSFIEALKKDEVLSRQRQHELELGNPRTGSKRIYRDTTKRIEAIVEEYAVREPLEYLRALAHNFQLQV